MHRVVNSLGCALDCMIHYIDVRMWDHKQGQEVWTKHPIIWPDEYATALYNNSKDNFRRCFAPIEDEEICQYWQHVQGRCPWFSGHPAEKVPQKNRLLPLSLYGDEINAFRNVENGSICVMGWTSDFANGNTALSRYHLTTCFSEHNSTEHTFDDIIRALLPRLQQMCEREDYVWSQDGWRWMYSSTQGDLKYITDRFHLHNFRKNAFCSWCSVCKKDPENLSNTLADFRENAAYRLAMTSHEDYMARTTAATRALACM